MQRLLSPQDLRWLAVLLSCLLPLETLALPVEPVPKIEVVVLEGAGSINNIQQGRARDPVVLVQSETQQPVQGATVTFTLPGVGPSGVFPDGQSMVIVVTDEQGRAVARGLRPNKIPGPFEIRVNASHQGQTATATLTQTNAAPVPVAEVSEEGGKSKTALLIGILAAAAAGGALAATRGGGGGGTGGSPPPATSSPTIISPGSPTFGPPR